MIFGFSDLRIPMFVKSLALEFVGLIIGPGPGFGAGSFFLEQDAKNATKKVK